MKKGSEFAWRVIIFGGIFSFLFFIVNLSWFCLYYVHSLMWLGAFPFEINNQSNYVALILKPIHFFLCSELVNIIQNNFSFFLGTSFTENYSYICISVHEETNIFTCSWVVLPHKLDCHIYTREKKMKD